MLKIRLYSIYVFLLLIIFFSCKDNDNSETETEGEISETDLVITATEDEVFNGNTVTFKVVDDTGTVTTNSPTINIDGDDISGYSHTFTTAGDHTVYAYKNDIKGKSITITSIESTHTTKVMVEDYTGTWCGWCPRLAYALEQTVELNGNIIPVALHNDNDMRYSDFDILASNFNITGYPSGRINRTIEWNESTSHPISLLKERKKCGLAINSSISGQNIDVEIKVHYDITEEDEQKLVVYLLENGLVYPQSNYLNDDMSSPYYNLGEYISGFVHNHTARATFTDPLGDLIPSSDTETDDTYTVNLSINIPSSIENVNSLEIVAFVVDANKSVVNVQKADLGENKDFD
ncbi:MAG: Omp28-related outer membrane protein [Flavobacteriaceae bacterium]|nr:Omp28-related outer membrane protein [Flavobacteriaceae bacterium]